MRQDAPPRKPTPPKPLWCLIIRMRSCDIEIVWKILLLLVLPVMSLSSCNATILELPTRLAPPSSHGSGIRLADSDHAVRVRTVHSVVGPKLIKMTRPTLPAGAKKAGVNTLVVLEGSIDENGNASVLRIIREIRC